MSREILQSEGKNVHFQKAVGPRGEGTSDLLVDGQINTGNGGAVVDVYTPTGSNSRNVLSNIAQKEDQAPNIIVYIRNNPSLTVEQFGTEEQILAKLRALIDPENLGIMRIRSVRVIK